MNNKVLLSITVFLVSNIVSLDAFSDDFINHPYTGSYQAVSDRQQPQYQLSTADKQAINSIAENLFKPFSREAIRKEVDNAIAETLLVTCLFGLAILLCRSIYNRLTKKSDSEEIKVSGKARQRAQQYASSDMV
jgi:hypothetical protein